MSKKIINSTIDGPEINKELSKLSEILFKPNSAQGKIKAQFWQRYKPGPFSEMVSLSVALEVTRASRLNKWWPIDGFKEWFANKDAVREKLSYLFDKALDSAEEILDNPESNPSAKASIIKMLAEMNGYLGKGQSDKKFADDDINHMSTEQLKKLIGNQLKNVKMVKETVIETEAKKVNNNDEKSETKEKVKDGSIRPDFPN